MISRRTLLLSATGLGGAVAFGLHGGFARSGSVEGDFEIMRTDAEWREILTPEQYDILREAGTEPAWSSSLNDEERKGVYHCAGCDNAVYPSATRFESGTGWPSFWDSLPGAVGTREDRAFFFMLRTEVHCARCGGHLGHIFDDGPPPTGLRHCLNGLALAFHPAASA